MISQESSSPDVEIGLQTSQYFQSHTSKPQLYIKRPKMDWIVNDRFLKWKLK